MNRLLALAVLLSFIGSARAETLGEVRTFATGYIKSVRHLGKTFVPTMETANFVWDGRRWCKEGSREASDALKLIYERYLNSSVRNE